MLSLDDSNLRITVDPLHGGKIHEIFAHRAGRNLLAPRLLDARLALEGEKDFSISGWIEAFPTLEAHGAIPTLGYVWRMPSESSLAAGSLQTQWHTEEWNLQRVITLGTGSMQCEYYISNLTTQPAPAIWAAHMLFNLELLTQVDFPAGDLIAGPQCDIAAAIQYIIPFGKGYRLQNLTAAPLSWKLFLPAKDAIVLTYADAVVRLSTSAPWWGIWLNLGRMHTRCIGIEPTNEATDYLSAAKTIIPAHTTRHYSLQLEIDYVAVGSRS